MKCSRYKKLIHALVDGELTRPEQRAVCAHLDACEDCSAYHQDLLNLQAALREPDREPPAEFRQKWKQQIAQAPQRVRKKKLKPAVLIPVAACCAAAVFVVSTILVNPQAFGLEGKSMTGEWFGAVAPEGSPEPPESSVDQGEGQRVSFVAKSEKKPNLLDFEHADYSEKTTTSSDAPALSATGTIEPRPNEILGAIQDAVDTKGTALPEGKPVLALSVTAGERERMREMAEEIGAVVVSEDEDSMVFEGSAEQIGEIAAGHHLEIPENSGSVRLCVS